jgi:hypothetical protein
MSPRRFDISVSVFERLFDVGFDELNEAEQTLVCVRTLIGEVDNEGFGPWMQSSSGRFAPHTPGALRRIGAYESARIVKDALHFFGSASAENDQALRHEAVEEITANEPLQLTELDAAFRNRDEDIEAYLSRYVLSRQDEFTVENP